MQREKYYPGTDIEIKSPFWLCKCRNCGHLVMSVIPVEKCSQCGTSIGFTCNPTTEVKNERNINIH